MKQQLHSVNVASGDIDSANLGDSGAAIPPGIKYCGRSNLEAPPPVQQCVESAGNPDAMPVMREAHPSSGKDEVDILDVIRANSRIYISLNHLAALGGALPNTRAPVFPLDTSTLTPVHLGAFFALRDLYRQDPGALKGSRDHIKQAINITRLVDHEAIDFVLDQFFYFSGGCYTPVTELLPKIAAVEGVPQGCLVDIKNTLPDMLPSGAELPGVFFTPSRTQGAAR